MAPTAYAGQNGPQPAVGYYKTVSAGVVLHVVQIDLSRKDVQLAVVTPEHGIGARETWASLVGRARPTAAITGTYFDTISGIPIGSIGVLGEAVHRGFIGTAFTYTPELGPSIYSARPNEHFDFGQASMFLRAGPRLMTDGQITLYPRDEGFRDPALFRPNPRTAIAISEAGKLLLVATTKPVYLSRLAEALQEMGVREAMGLDGGSSTALYYRGKSFVAPRRMLTNALVVYETEERFQQQVLKLNPHMRR